MERRDFACRRLLVTGRVQGVGYRWACQRLAQALGVTGWVRNRPDGTVEVFVEGRESAVEQLVAWCHTGPPGARVTDVADESATPQGRSEFAISY